MGRGQGEGGGADDNARAHEAHWSSHALSCTFHFVRHLDDTQKKLSLCPVTKSERAAPRYTNTRDVWYAYALTWSTSVSSVTTDIDELVASIRKLGIVQKAKTGSSPTRWTMTWWLKARCGASSILLSSSTQCAMAQSRDAGTCRCGIFIRLAVYGLDFDVQHCRVG